MTSDRDVEEVHTTPSPQSVAKNFIFSNCYIDLLTILKYNATIRGKKRYKNLETRAQQGIAV
jgi:hypothetical protein